MKKLIFVICCIFLFFLLTCSILYFLFDKLGTGTEELTGNYTKFNMINLEYNNDEYTLDFNNIILNKNFPS